MRLFFSLFKLLRLLRQVFYALLQRQLAVILSKRKLDIEQTQEMGIALPERPWEARSLG